MRSRKLRQKNKLNTSTDNISHEKLIKFKKAKSQDRLRNGPELILSKHDYMNHLNTFINLDNKHKNKINITSNTNIQNTKKSNYIKNNKNISNKENKSKKFTTFRNRINNDIDIKNNDILDSNEINKK